MQILWVVEIKTENGCEPYAVDPDWNRQDARDRRDFYKRDQCRDFRVTAYVPKEKAQRGDVIFRLAR